MTDEERTERLIEKLSPLEAERFRDMLGLTGPVTVKSSFAGSKAIPSNRRTASHRRGHE